MKNIWLRLSVLFQFYCISALGNYTFIGYLTLPFKKEPIDFCIYFDGSCIPVQYSSYIFTGYSTQINVLITAPENIIHFLEPDNCTLKLVLKKDKSKKDNYRFYKLNRIVKDGLYTWNIQQAEIDDIIPFNTIRLQLDPNKIDIKLDNATWKLDAKKIKLPQILISGEKELIKDQLLRCCLSLADCKPFHAKQKTKVVEADNLTLKSALE